MLVSITEFFGHFHPVVVHLPIGILVMAVVLYWISLNPKFTAFRLVVPFVVLCGMITAIIACISGYLLSISGDYNGDTVDWHMWMGISVAVVSILWYLQETKFRLLKSVKFLSAGLFILIMITGHLGGALTHGSDYLTGPLVDIFSGDGDVNTVFSPVPDVQEADVYADLVKPVFQTRCYSCHGPNKQKGGLRMDDSLKLMAGGKEGVVIEPHNAEESEMIRRILLPVDNDDHMPPKEKGQLSEPQIALLNWWIDNGAPFAKKVKELEQPEKIKPILLTFENGEGGDASALAFIPASTVERADEKVFEQLNARGIMVLPLGKETNYLSANFFTDTLINDEDMELLLSLKKQLLWLRIGFTNLNDQQLSKIAELTNLTRLNLEHTKTSDNGIEKLKSLKKLQYLNVVGTRVTAKGIMALKDLKELRSIYVYQTGVVKPDWPALKAAFPETLIDSGGYRVPTFEADTTEVKYIREEQ